MTHKEKRRHPKYWPNVVKDDVMMLELRQPNPASSERKPNRMLVTTKSGGADPSPPSKCRLQGGDNVSRAAQSRGLNVFKVAHQGGRPHFEFYCAKTGGFQTSTVWRGEFWLPDTHRLARGILIAANHSESVRVFQQNTPICQCLCVQTLRRQRLDII
jgi:hypothetical protein